MPHQNPEAPRAAEQNSATGSGAPNDQAREQHRTVRPEPRSYAATDVYDATLAPPATGEMAAYADEGEATGFPGQQQGQTHTRRPAATEARSGQGAKTRAANQRVLRAGAAD